MKLLRSTMIFAMLLGLAISMAACSGGTGPTDPGTNNVPDTFGSATEDGRSVITAYQLDIDLVAETVNLSPLDRFGEYHFPLSDYYSVLTITGYHFGPFWADLKLTHPFPGSGISGYDARVIGVLPAVAGFSMGYPGHVVQANNSVVLEPDGYTKLWDKGLTGNTNPFLAYFKSQPFRVWSSTGVTTETRRWNMDLAGFGGGPLSYILVVDVSTNFPAAPTPILDNCPEPAEIVAATVGEGMTPAGGSAPVNVTVLDWQGTGQPITVSIEAPALKAGTTALTYAGPHPTEPNQYIFSGTITNTLLAPEGDYDMLVAAKDNAKAVFIYDEFVAHVGQEQQQGAWQLDPNRGNVNMTEFTQTPLGGSDLCVVDSGIPDYDGVLMYDEFSQVVRADLGLTDGDIYGYAYLPWDLNPGSPHPNPDDPMLAGRIDSANNGFVFRSWVDPHEGIGPDGNGDYQRCDDALGMFSSIGGWLESIIVCYFSLNPPNDAERPALTDVWDEADTGMGAFVQGGYWRGTVIKDPTNTFFKYGIVGGFISPYFDGVGFLFDWGAWAVSGPPMAEIVAMDASQDPIYAMQYWAYSGPNIGPAVIAWYTKDVVYMDAYEPAGVGNVIDIELIPLQSPPLVVEGKTQFNDWLAIMFDGGEIHVIDPFMPAGELVATINTGVLTGTPKYLDVADNSADIFVSHTDGVNPYCSVFTVH
ncbi:MAG: hypothetical protein ABIG42_03565 [bacterium]